MYVRYFAILGAAAAFVAVNSTDADAFFRKYRAGKIVTCYKKITTPAVYRTVMKRVMVRAASCSQYRTPATYGTVAQQVMVKPAYQVVHTKPALYGRVQVTRQVRPARTRWMRRGCRGEGYRCTVTTPAKYRTRSKRVMMQPSRNWVETRPAVMGVVQKQVMISAGTVKQVCQPAVYQTVAESVLVTPATEQWVQDQSTGNAVMYRQSPYRAPVYRPAMRQTPVSPVPGMAPLK